MRPRLLLLSDVTELEWTIRPFLEDWADVVSFDAPGVGGRPFELPVTKAMVRRALELADERRWDDYFVVADEMVAFTAVELALARPEAVLGLALGHACLRFARTGPAPTVNDEVFDVYVQMLEANYASLVRQDMRVWSRTDDDSRSEGDLDALLSEWMSRVSPEVARKIATAVLDEIPDGTDIESALRDLDRPLLLAQHVDCVGWRNEGYAEAVRAFPDATTFRSRLKPTVDPDFAIALRQFCERISG